MFKTCMKTYFSNLKYVFTVLGIVFIFLLIGISTFIKASGSSMEAIVMEIGSATKSVDFNVLGTKGGFFLLLGALKTYFYEIVAEVMTAIITLVTNIITLIGTILLGIFVANITVILFGRYDINHDNIFKVILEQLFRYLCILFCIFVILLFGYIFGFKIALILLALYPIGYCFIALFSAWVTCGKKNRAKWGDTVTFKNMMLLLASNLLEIVMTAAIGLIAFYIFDMVVAIVIALGLAVLVTATTNLNAYAFMYQKGSEATEIVVGVKEITIPKEEFEALNESSVKTEVESTVEEKVEPAVVPASESKTEPTVEEKVEQTVVQTLGAQEETTGAVNKSATQVETVVTEIIMEEPKQ